MAKVLYAKLSKTGFVPGLGEIPQTLPPPSKSWDLNMRTTDLGLLMSAVVKNKEYQILFPYSTVEAMSLEVEKTAVAAKSNAA